MHFGCSIAPGRGRVVQVTECWDGVGPYSGGITVGEAAMGLKGQNWPLDNGLAERQRGRHGGSPEQVLSHYGAKDWSGH
jgi:hypothetical protein